ncbi:MAG: tRNA uridine-5-carboxymethylaminomethyl(34) synthesis enzyme MnmG, partial [Actinobacteria bacterium]|nr:tRNA uridine-5-carboxymethylaminomethyl(34) synthesis enzyme MnmG [Actinomycetota bacterium]
MKENCYDVIVIGAGHAGCEAALVSSRMGCRTLLLTISLDKVALMPCNPAIGGIGKGQLVREIDALGGEMGRMVDSHTIHSRRANASRGPAAQSPFAIADKGQYQLNMKYLLERADNLRIRQTLISKILPKEKHLLATSTFGEEFLAKAVVITAGTFLRGEIMYGDVTESAGRYGEISSPELSKSMLSLGFKIGRFKMGTSPRVSARTVDPTSLEAQLPDDEPEPFSFWNDSFNPERLLCHKTHSTDLTRQIILEHMNEAPSYSGAACAIGKRYCPLIEDKVVRYPRRNRHSIFLQPEGIDQSEIYLHGLSTSLRPGIQKELVRSIPGLESAEITRPGYAVVYD